MRNRSIRPLLSRARRLAGFRALGCMLGLGCSGDELTLPGDRDPLRIVVVGGDGQTGNPNGLLADPLEVRVLNALDQPVVKTPVVFEAEAGVVSPDTAVSDNQGRAATRWIAGGKSGTQRARAYLADLTTSTAVFTAVVVAAARARLDLMTQPSPLSQSGMPLEQQPRVRVADLLGAPIREPGVMVVAALASGGGTLCGTTSVPTDAEGVATFTDLALEGAGGPYTVIFAAVGLTSVAARPIAVQPDPVPPRRIEISERTPAVSDVGRSVFFRIGIVPEPGGAPADSSFFLNASTGESCRGSIFDRTCGLIFNSPGERTIVATLPASDGRPVAESPVVTHMVNPVKGPTRTSIGVEPDPADPGDRLTVFARVIGEGGEPARGSVVLYLDGGGCGRGELLGQIFELNSRGEGTLRVGPFPEPGYHEVRGCYTGAVGFAPSEDVAGVVVRP